MAYVFCWLIAGQDGECVSCPPSIRRLGGKRLGLFSRAKGALFNWLERCAKGHPLIGVEASLLPALRGGRERWRICTCGYSNRSIQCNYGASHTRGCLKHGPSLASKASDGRALNDLELLGASVFRLRRLGVLTLIRPSETAHHNHRREQQPDGVHLRHIWPRDGDHIPVVKQRPPIDPQESVGGSGWISTDRKQTRACFCLAHPYPSRPEGLRVGDTARSRPVMRTDKAW